MSDSELEDYAKKQINAEAYSDDVHLCTYFRCKHCQQIVPFSLLISYSNACDKNRPSSDFAGTVYSTCSMCGSVGTPLSIIRGEHPEVEKEHPVCSCGSNSFFLYMCERYEGAHGLEGFFDEGVLVGKCSTCGNLRTVLFID